MKNCLRIDIDWLINTYPDCFSRETPKPLKRGILNDIVAGELWIHSKKRLRQTLAYYTGSPFYQKSILQEAQRYSLEGEAIQDIIDHEKEYSKERLKRFKTKKRKVKTQRLEKD